jgi:hypothetical protein
MGLEEHITLVEQELARARRQLDEQAVMVRALEEQLRVLKAHAIDPAAGARDRTEVILEVLRQAEAPLPIREICDRLAAVGRIGETGKLVTATLSYMLRQGRVERVGRGLYRAAA